MSGIAITFPSSPSEGQSYLAQNGFTYIYDIQKNRWKRGGEFVRAPKVLSYAGVAVTTTGSGITTGPTGALIYNVPGFVVPNSTVGVDSYKAYRAAESYPNYTEVQVSISSAFSSVAYAATFTGTTHTIPSGTLSGNTTYYLRARQFVGSDAASAGVGAISGYSQNIVSFATTSTFIDTPTIVSISGSTDFPVYQIGYASTTLPATVTYTGSGVGNLEQVDWRVTGPRIPTSTGDTALAEVGIGTHSSTTLANSLVLALPFSGATGVSITDDVNNAIRTASGASAGTTKTITANGNAGIATVSTASTTSHFYDGAAYFDGTGDYLTSPLSTDFQMGSGDFTVECWFNSFTQTGLIVNCGNIIFSGSTGWALFLVLGTLYARTSPSSSNDITVSNIALNTWNHVAYVRKNTIHSLYLNGYLVGSKTIASVTDSSSNLAIGYDIVNSIYPYTGYIQDLKVYKGIAKYTENFTPPLPTYGTISYTTGITNVGVTTTAFYQSTGDVGIAETSSTAANALVLAMPMNKTFGFQDINVAIRGLTSGASAGTAKTVGLGTTSTANAPTHPRISATESKWYDGAAYFDKSKSQYCTSTSSDYAIGSNDVTIECWINSTDVSTTSSGSHIFQVDGAATNILLAIGDSGNGDVRFLIRNDSGTNLLNINAPANTLTTNTWYHLAGTLSGTSGRLFVNGNLVASGTLSGTRTHTGTNAYFGTNAGSRYYGGYIQDLKFYKGLAKYTANFTPPQPICGFSTDISTQTGFTTTTASGALLSSVVGLGSTSTLAFDAGTTYAGITSITSSSGITTLPDPYAQNLVLALPLADITGAGTSFTNDRNTQIRSVSLVGGGSVKTGTNTGITTSTSALKSYNNSAYFTSSYLTYSNDSDFQLSGTDWTFECWVNPDGNYANYNTLIAKRDTGTEWEVYLRISSGVLSYYNGTNYESSVSPTANVWNHIAATNQNGTIRLFLNGKLVLSGNYATNSGTNNVYVGTYGAEYTKGYMQDVRLYKGVAKYTTNFTPPPPMFGDYVRNSNKIVFTPGSDYVLEAKNTSGEFASSYSATRQWGTKPEGGIYDPYAGNLVLAIPGGAQGGITTAFDVTGQIKLETPTSTYSSGQVVTSPSGATYTNKSVTLNGNVANSATQSKYYGRSLYFDGTGDYLDVTGTTDFDFGTGDYTVECWARYETNADEMGLFATNKFVFRVDGVSSSYRVQSWHSDGGTFLTGTTQLIVDTWYHLAISKFGTTRVIYVNGIEDARGTITQSVTGTTSAVVGTVYLGNANSEEWKGYIQDLRVYKGVAKYTSNFTPPNQIYLT